MAEQPPFEPLPTGDRTEPSIYAARPPSTGETKLEALYYERYADQNRQMDELAKQMITVELAVPGVYASILALLRGQAATLPAGAWLAVAFGGWALALLLTFLALFPRDYRVDPTIMRADPAADDGVLGIEEYFRRPARYKWRLLAGAAVAFWVGLAAAIGVLFIGP
jgi:hypothetical protein